MKHGIVGTGTAPEKVIHDGLREALGDGDEIVMVWSGTPVPSGMEHVYSYILDNEIPFTLLYVEDQKIPGAFRMAEHGIAQKVRDPKSSLFKAVDGNILFMWDDGENEDGGLIDEVFDALPGVTVLELTNGLAPIVTEEAPEIQAPVVEDDDDEDDDTSFTREQLESMTAFAVKQYGARLGCKGATKAAIIDELFGDSEQEEPAAPAQEKEQVLPSPVNPTRESDNSFHHEMVTLIGNFYEHYKPGFNADMAHLLMGQARLWMLKTLSE